MIESILIFQDCGLLLYENKWKINYDSGEKGKNSKDPEELVSGFMSVMFSYFSDRYGTINAIKTKKNIILIKKIENFFIALVVRRYIHETEYYEDLNGKESIDSLIYAEKNYKIKNYKNNNKTKATIKKLLSISKDNYVPMNSIESEIWLFNQRIEEISHNLLISIVKKIRKEINLIRKNNLRYKISDDIFISLDPIINLIIKNGNQRIKTIEEIFKEKIDIIISLQTNAQI